MSATPIDLFTSFINLRPDGQAHAGEQTFDLGREGWHIMTFHVETDADVHADHWEIHSDADEIVSCLTGGIRMYFRPEREGEGEKEVGLTSGTAVVVPRGRWHRIELDAPSDIMSVTVLRGSRLEERTGA
ncbi:cupin [Streptomyces griseocarneus]|nr:cupin [Streptomyces griseocarneus]